MDKECFLKVYLVNGNSNQIRFNELTDIGLIISLLTSRLSSDGLDRPLKSLYSIRVFKYPNIDLNQDDIIWLDNETTLIELIKKFDLNIESCRFELRIRFFPFTFQQILEKDRVTFYYLYDQIKNDYFNTKKEINHDLAINLCCLEIRRFFKDISQFALDKKSNYETLEKEIGLHKFLPSTIISKFKPKVLRKLIQNQFKNVLNLDEIQCMIKFLNSCDELLHFKMENYNCEFKIFINYLPVKLCVGYEVGISYLTDNSIAPTQMTAFNQIEYFQTLFKEELKCNESTMESLLNKKFKILFKIFGADELLSIICPSLIVVMNIAQLIDGYCKLQFKNADSLWINKYNNFLPVQTKKIENTQIKNRPRYDNEEKDYAEIVEEQDYYSVPNCKLKDIDRSQIKTLNLIGKGEFGDVYRGLYKNEFNEEIEIAVKTCKSDKENNLTEKFLDEAMIMANFEHKHIIKILGICQEMPAFLLEFARFGDLRKFLHENKSTIDLSKLILYAYQLSTALNYLENKNYVHRDLAARNVLVTSLDCVKLADFGLSRYLVYNDSSYYKASNCKLPIKWLAPESINFRRFTKSSDIWSFAVLIWEILSYGTKPFENIKNSVVIQKIENGERLDMPPNCPANLYNLLLHCWRYEPSARPDIKQIESFLMNLLNLIENKKIDDDIFSDDFRKSLMEIQLKSQEKISEEDSKWLKNEEKEIYGSNNMLNTSQFSLSDNQSLKSETTSTSSNNDSKLSSYTNSSKNPFIDSLENSMDKSDAQQNLNRSSENSSSLELNRENDDVYNYTRILIFNIKQLIDHINKGEVDLYVDRLKSIGLELKNLLTTVDNLIVELPECYHNEISLTHNVLSKDYANLLDSMKQAQKHNNTTIENEFKKKVYKSCHVLVIDSKELLDTIDSVRLKLKESIRMI